MKKHFALFAALSILACLIVLPAFRSVNASADNSSASAPFLIAEGNPMPNPLPPALRAGTLVAEGNPMPNPLPPASHSGTLIAEANPMPNPRPSGTHSIELMTIA